MKMTRPILLIAALCLAACGGSAANQDAASGDNAPSPANDPDLNGIQFTFKTDPDADFGKSWFVKHRRQRSQGVTLHTDLRAPPGSGGEAGTWLAFRFAEFSPG